MIWPLVEPVVFWIIAASQLQADDQAVRPQVVDFHCEKKIRSFWLVFTFWHPEFGSWAGRAGQAFLFGGLLCALVQVALVEAANRPAMHLPGHVWEPFGPPPRGRVLSQTARRGEMR